MSLCPTGLEVNHAAVILHVIQVIKEEIILRIIVEIPATIAITVKDHHHGKTMTKMITMTTSHNTLKAPPPPKSKQVAPQEQMKNLQVKLETPLHLNLKIKASLKLPTTWTKLTTN